MVEQQGTPKKAAVGSLFFHFFNRFSLWIYTLLCNCFAARLLTSYELLEDRWSHICERVLGPAGGKFRRNVHTVRLSVAGALERSKPIKLLSKLVRFLVYCPVNVYGVFFFVYGALGAAVYMIGDRLAVNYAGDIGWGITGLVVLVASLPLLCCNKPLYYAAFGSRTLGKILRRYLGLERKGVIEKRERGNTVLFYLALLLGAGFGGCTFFYHPATVPVCAAVLVAVLTVLYIPESGILLALISLPYWWCTGNPVLCAVAISLITLIGFGNKLLHGRRVMQVRLVDFTVLLLILGIALYTVLSGAGMASVLYACGYCVMLAMYFPVVNLMHSRDWLERCYKLLVISGAVLSVMNLLSYIDLLEVANQLLSGADLTMFDLLLARYSAYFGDHVKVSGILLLLIPIMISGMIRKRTMSSVFWRAIWVAAGCASVVLFMQFGAWAGLFVAILVFLFAYSYKALSASFLLAFPAACGAVWAIDVDRILGVRSMKPVQQIQNVVVTFCDGAGQRARMAQCVREMIKAHPVGIGWGEQAFSTVFGQFAQPGMEGVQDTGSTYLQLLASGGWGSVILMMAVLLMFLLCVLTYLRWATYTPAKARVAAGFAGILGVLTLGLTCDFWSRGSVFMSFWLVLALTVACVRTQYGEHFRAVQTHGATDSRADVSWRNKR